MYLAVLMALHACVNAAEIDVRVVPPSETAITEQWTAQWIWGSERPHGPLGCFRKAFTVDGEVAHAWVQSSGDDGYTVYVNGEEVHKGGFWWKRTDKYDIAEALRPGANVIAAEVRNHADPGGLIIELAIAYADGRTQTIATDASWRFFKEAPEGWKRAGFDESVWAACTPMGSPPIASPWGDIPFTFLGHRPRVDVAECAVPGHAAAGQSLPWAMTLTPRGTLPGDPALVISLSKDGEQVLREAWALRPAPGSWAEDAPREVRHELALSPYLPAGEYELGFAMACADLMTADGQAVAPARLTIDNPRQGEVTPVAIKEHRGAPALCIDGRPEFPLWFWQRVISEQDAAAFHEAGVDVLTFCCPGYYLSPGWVGENTYDYRQFDASVIELLRRNPDALCIPRVFVGAPAWWLDKHPEEACGFATGVGWQDNGWGGTKHESFASQLWREEAGEAFRRFVRHIAESSYSSRVIGIHVANGIYGEWHTWSATDIPDTSEPMRQAFIRGLRRVYADDAARLRKAWGDDTAEFDSVTIPTLEERRSADVGLFRDPAVSRKVADYYACLHRETVDAIDHFCGIVKEASNGSMLTCVFYSYAPDLNWPQEGDHRAAARAHRLPNIDIFSSPHSYARRALGEDGLFRNFPASLALHGKLFVDEADGRTHRAKDPTFTHVDSLDGSIEVIRRQFANAVTHAVGLWYMDQQGDWFHDERIMQEMAHLKQLGDRSMACPRGSVAEVAVISSLESEFYLAGRDSGLNHVTLPLYQDLPGALCRSGAPFDWFLIEDLAEGLVPPHKVYLFLDCFYVTPAQRTAIDALKAGGATLVWFYAPGYVTDEGLSLAESSALTGIQLEQRGKGALAVRPAAPLEETAPFGPEAVQSPVLTVADPAAAVWGTSAGTNAAALAVKECAGWRSVYSGTPYLPAEVLRRIFSEAGVHIYCDANDNINANASWFSIHTASAGSKTIRLPGPMAVYDAFNDKPLGTCSEFNVDLPAGATALYHLEAR